MTTDEFDLPTTLTDEQALRLIEAIRRQNGFAIVCMTRGDAESVWHDIYFDFDTEEVTIPDMPDDLWEEIKGTWAWRKGFGSEAIMDDAWYLVREAVGDGVREREKK